MSLLSMIAQLGININPFAQGLNKAKHHAQEFGADVAKDLKRELAGAFAVGAVFEFGKKVIEFGAQISQLAERLEVSTTSLQEWNYAAEQNGATAEHVTKFFESLNVAQNNALDGNEQSIESFKRLGVTIKDLRSLRTDEIGKIIGETVRHGDVQKLENDLKEIGGKGGRYLIAAFKSGLGESAKAAHELGLIIDDNVLKTLHESEKSANRLKRTFMSMTAPVLGGFAKDLDSTLQLLKAYGQKWDPKQFRFTTDFISFLNSQEAQKIVAGVEHPPGENEEPHRELRKFTPPKEGFDSDVLGKNIGRLSVDSLAGIGGFVGNAANVNPVVDIARQQLEEQRKIAKNTEPKPGNTDKFSYQ